MSLHWFLDVGHAYFNVAIPLFFPLHKTKENKVRPESSKQLQNSGHCQLVFLKKRNKSVYIERKHLWSWIQKISLIMPLLSLSTKYFCIQLIPPCHDELDVPVSGLSLRYLNLGKMTEMHPGSSIFKLWMVQDFCVNINFSRLLLPESFRSCAYNLCLP